MKRCVPVVLLLLWLVAFAFLPSFAQRSYPGPQYYVENTPHDVIAGDFNEDGHLDLFVANNGSANVSVLLSNGDGTFAEPYNIGVGNGPTGLASGDLNNDSHLDIVCTNYSGDSISVILGNG